MKKSQVKIGAILSYVLIILNALYGLIIAPFIIRHLGSSNYGVYKTITALTSSLIVIDLGLGGTIQRFTAKFIAEKEETRIPNFVAMGLLIAFLLCVTLSIISGGIYFLLDFIYGNTFSENQLVLAKGVFIVSAITVLVHVIENVFYGLIAGFNRFIFGNGIKVLLLISRIIAIVVFLSFYNDALGLVVVILVVNSIFLIINICYVVFRLKVRVKLEKWEPILFFEAGKFTILLFLTSLVTQITANLDNVVIGAIKGAEYVTVYSVGLLIFGMFSQLSCGISGVMLPTVTNVLKEDKNNQKIIDLIVKVGRIQFLLLGAAIAGFAIIGKDFVNQWMGDGFDDVYVITLILIIPAIFELCINVCLSILQAKNKLGFRTIALSISALVNAIITVILVKYWSYIGAAIGTAFSYIACSLIAMNIYYSKKLNLPMLHIYKNIVSRIWVCLLLSSLALVISSRFLNGDWLSIVINILVFCFIYSISLLLFGLKKEEKKAIPIIRKMYKDDE